MFNPFVSKSSKNKPGRILLVEDDRIIAAAELKLLKKLGYSVTVAASGKEAVDIINANPSDTDLILMDIDLGRGMDGTAAVREILKLHDIPVLFLSGSSDPDTIERLDDVLSYGFVVKGADISILAASIKMAFRLHM